VLRAFLLNKMGRFWIDDDFVREQIEIYKLSLKAIAVYIALCSHADRNGFSFIGYRALAKELNVSKNTVTAGVAELVVSHLVVQSTSKRGRVSHLRVVSVPNEGVKVSHALGPKEEFKEVYKEEEISLEQKERAEAIKKKIRDKFSWH
jgi:DNA-binding MarR family transcriptional regulator